MRKWNGNGNAKAGISLWLVWNKVHREFFHPFSISLLLFGSLVFVRPNTFAAKNSMEIYFGHLTLIIYLLMFSVRSLYFFFLCLLFLGFFSGVIFFRCSPLVYFFSFQFFFFLFASSSLLPVSFLFKNRKKANIIYSEKCFDFKYMRPCN